MLHIISTDRQLEQYLNKLSVGDAVLFIEEAVMQLHYQSLFVKLGKLQSKSTVFYALAADTLLYGLNKGEITPAVQLVDYAGFVALTEKHKVIKSWH